MNRYWSLALGSLVVFAAGCTIRSSRRPPPPRYGYAPPNAVGVKDTRAETYAPQRPHPAQFGSAFIFLPGNTQRTQVTYQNVNGMAIYEGDIMLGPVHQVHTLYGFPRFKPNPAISYATSTPKKSHLWQGGVMPYEIDSSVTPEKRSYVEWAVAHVTQKSVLTLRPRTGADSDYVVFTEQGGGYGCSSYVGRVGGAQEIKVRGCAKGSVVHEIGHASGFYHEQSRTDRDSYVRIDWDQISPGHERWFEIRRNANDIGQYDYGSIMHYSKRAFSKGDQPTIIPLDPNATIGQREGLSPLDVAALAQLYSGGGGGGGGGGTGTPPPPATGFAGTYSSNRGDVSCNEAGATVNCSFPGGTMVCTVQGSQLDCGWFGTGQGRAVFTRQANGDLRGTYGNLLSNNDMGAWDMTRTGGGGGGGTTGTPPGGSPPFGIPGLPPIPTTLPPGIPPLPFPTQPPPQ